LVRDEKVLIKQVLSVAPDLVAEQLKKHFGAVVDEVLGLYDIVLDIEADNQEDITAGLRNIVCTPLGVTNTVTGIYF
jgi:hypothetical protein